MPSQLPAQAGSLRPGDRIGRCVVRDMLRAGGMGRVYRADGPDGSVAAVKVIRAEYAAEPGYRRRFERELRLAQLVDHPHVLPVLESGSHRGMLFFTTPYVSGGALDECLHGDGPLAPGRAADLCVQIAAGLGALHAAGIVHRDVKPPNVLLADGDQALVADFGIARHRDASALTEPGQVIGSAPYMAPEQIRGEEITPAADVYSLGCTAYELLTGVRPFAGRRGADLLLAHLSVTPPDPVTHRPDLSPDLAWAVMRALEKDPAARPPTATSFARMLQVSSPASRFLPARR
jgi:serine/threonine protein kinase